MARPLAKDVMSVSALNSSGAPMKLAIGVPLAAVSRKDTIWVAERLTALSVSHVTFAELTPGQIDAYVDTGEPLGKAGAYGVQGRAGMFIPHLSGSYSGIMGLPAHETAQVLQAAGVRLI